MVNKNPKTEATRKQGEAQVEHATNAPDAHMEAEGMLAENNPEASAREAEDAERDRPTSMR